MSVSTLKDRQLQRRELYRKGKLRAARMPRTTKAAQVKSTKRIMEASLAATELSFSPA